MLSTFALSPMFFPQFILYSHYVLHLYTLSPQGKGTEATSIDYLAIIYISDGYFIA